jgi:aldehyde dehydrogenase (NAD+)
VKTRLVAFIREKIKTGDPRDRTTVVGPMITAAALAEVRERIDEALAAGATLVHGGQTTGRCLEATVLENVAPNLDLCAKEAFAPIVTLHRYREFDEALAFVNASDFGLQAGVFTRDLPLALRAFDQLDVGGVLINQVPTFRVENMPYGGIKDSGFGREGVRYAMEEMTELKSLIIKRS